MLLEPVLTAAAADACGSAQGEWGAPLRWSGGGWRSGHWKQLRHLYPPPLTPPLCRDPRSVFDPCCASPSAVATFHTSTRPRRTVAVSGKEGRQRTGEWTARGAAPPPHGWAGMSATLRLRAPPKGVPIGGGDCVAYERLPSRVSAPSPLLAAAYLAAPAPLSLSPPPPRCPAPAAASVDSATAVCRHAAVAAAVVSPFTTFTATTAAAAAAAAG